MLSSYLTLSPAYQAKLDDVLARAKSEGDTSAPTSARAVPSRRGSFSQAAGAPSGRSSPSTEPSTPKAKEVSAAPSATASAMTSVREAEEEDEDGAILRSPSGLSLSSDDASVAVGERLMSYRIDGVFLGEDKDSLASGAVDASAAGPPLPEPELWNLTELLTLAQAVAKIGEHDWSAVSKTMRSSLPAAIQAFYRGSSYKPITRQDPAFFSPKRCEGAWLTLKSLEEKHALAAKKQQRNRKARIRREIQQLSQAITQIEKEIPLIEEGKMDDKLQEMSEALPEVNDRTKRKRGSSVRPSPAVTPRKGPASAATTPRPGRTTAPVTPSTAVGATLSPSATSTPSMSTTPKGGPSLSHKRGRKRGRSDLEDIEEEDAAKDRPGRASRQPSTRLQVADKKSADSEKRSEVRAASLGKSTKVKSEEFEEAAAAAEERTSGQPMEEAELAEESKGLSAEGLKEKGKPGRPKSTRPSRDERSKPQTHRRRSAVAPEGESVDESVSTKVKEKEEKAAKVEPSPQAVHNSILEIVTQIIAHDDSYPFRRPVTKKDAPDYEKIIKKKMDLGTLKGLIVRRKITTFDTFKYNICLVFDNAMEYNKKKSLIYQFAADLKKKALEMIAEAEKRVAETT